MNTRIPLVATFLMTASTAMAGAISRPSIPDDPAGIFGPFQVMQPDVQWASPDCTRIPCRTVGSPTTPVPKEGDPGFIGPLSRPNAPVSPGEREPEEIVVTGRRPKAALPPPFPAESFQKELADARADNEHQIVDMGDNRYGVIIDGKVAVCGMGQCNVPRKMTDAEATKFAADKQLDSSINSGKGSINDPANNKGTGNTPVSLSSTDNSDGGTNDGQALGDGLSALGNDSDTPGAGTGIGGPDGPGLGASAEVKVGKIDCGADKAQCEPDGITYNGLKPLAKTLGRLEAAAAAANLLDDRPDTGRINVDSTLGGKKRQGDVDAVANGDPTP